MKMDEAPALPEYGLVLLDHCVFGRSSGKKWADESVHGLDKEGEYLAELSKILSSQNNWMITSLVRREYREGNEELVRLCADEPNTQKRASLYDLLKQRMITEELIEPDKRNIGMVMGGDERKLKRKLKPKIEALFTRHGGRLGTRRTTDIDLIATALVYSHHNEEMVYMFSRDNSLTDTLEDCVAKIKGYDFSSLGIVDCQGVYRFNNKPVLMQ